ncbi:MAG: YjbH domain-containing protein [Aliishimia sp.]
MTEKRKLLRYALVCLLSCLWTTPVWAESVRLSFSTYGTPGLIDMPVALSAPDAELVVTASYFENITRSTLSFQITPRLSAAFRYSGLEGLGGSVRDNLFDRSFDLQLRVLDEGRVVPAVAIGLRDFIGTGVYSSEYIVATKNIGTRVSLTGGVGWGRLGRRGYLERADPTATTNQGGQFETTRWFRGKAAFFGGVAWQINDRAQLKLEYSSDSYIQEEAGAAIDRRNQVNIGVDYRLNDKVALQAFHLYGATFGVAINVRNNPKSAKSPSGTHAAPYPVRPRGAARDLGWVNEDVARRTLREALAIAMRHEGLVVEGLDLSGTRVQIHVRNTRYNFTAEAVGRTARVLTQVLPDSVEQFEITLSGNGVATSQVRFSRTALERYEHAPDGPERMLQNARIQEANLETLPRFDPTLYPRFTWGLGPYLRASYFDPDRPVLADFGLRLNAEYSIAPGLFLAGSVRKTIVGNIDQSDRPSNSVIQRVRSESNRFLREGDPALETLTLAYLFRPGRALYGRITLGYLEAQYAGLSAELLWKPVQSRLALGIEVNFVKQRDFDQLFGFQSYDVTTGHISGYYSFGNGYHAQVDVGRYLAGDWGTSISIDREFANGWRIGAYATFTDVSFEDFGEGSFDKGLRFTIPLSPFLGQPSRRKFGVTLQPLTRDGGARVHVDGRLYESVRNFHASGLESSWGRFWR